MIFMLSRYINFFLVISLSAAYIRTSNIKFNTFKLASKKEKDSFFFLPKLLIKALPLLISAPILYENNVVQSIQVAIADDYVPIKYDKIAPWNDKIKYRYYHYYYYYYYITIIFNIFKIRNIS